MCMERAVSGQGAGVGMRFLNTICQMWRDGQNRYGKPMPTLFHTSHPGMCAALRRSPLWTQVSARLYGENKAKGRGCVIFDTIPTPLLVRANF